MNLNAPTIRTIKNLPLNSRLFFTLLVLLLMQGCQSTGLNVSYELKDNSFQNYQHVKVETLNDPSHRSIGQLVSAMELKLSNLGYQLSSSPDLVIVFEVDVDKSQKLNLEQLSVMGRIYTRPKLEAVNQATITINAYDPKLDSVVWKASTQKDITHIKADKIQQELVNKRVSELFASFPEKSS